MIEIACSLQIGVVCILVQNDVPSETYVKTQLASLDGHITSVNAYDVDITKFKESVQSFNNSVSEITGTFERWKRQAPSLGDRRRVLNAGQLSKIQSVRSRVGGLTRSRTITNRLTSNRRIAVGGGVGNTDQGAATDNVQDTPRERTNLPRVGAAPMNGEDGRLPGERNGKEMCMGGWKRFGRSCVKLEKNAVSWNLAKTECETFIYKQSKATLINLSDEGVRNRLSKMLTVMEDGDIQPFWTSGNDVNIEGALQWDESNAMTQAGAISGNSEENDCVVYQSDNLQFESCEETFAYVCEMREPNITDEDLVR